MRVKSVTAYAVVINTLEMIDVTDDMVLAVFPARQEAEEWLNGSPVSRVVPVKITYRVKSKR